MTFAAAAMARLIYIAFTFCYDVKRWLKQLFPRKIKL